MAYAAYHLIALRGLRRGEAAGPRCEQVRNLGLAAREKARQKEQAAREEQAARRLSGNARNRQSR
jgi:hypothetical protein